jgi:hypothetical protein
MGSAVDGGRRDALRADVAGWVTRRRSVLDRLVASAGVMPPVKEVTDAYVDPHACCVRTGHDLGARDYVADRCVAAVAIASRLPLATENATFDGQPSLRRAYATDASRDHRTCAMIVYVRSSS